MNRRRIAIGVCSVSGLAVAAAGAMNLFSAGTTAQAVDLHATPVAAVGAAPAATGKAGTAQVDTLVTVATPAIPARGKAPALAAKTVTMHGTGLFDFGKQVGKIDLTTVNGGMEEVLTPATLYARVAATAPNAATSAKGWQRMDIAQSSDGNLFSGGATDPAMTFAMLAGAEPGVRFVGQDQVRGVPVAHYQGTLDLKQAADAAGQAAAAAAAGAGTAAESKSKVAAPMAPAGAAAQAEPQAQPEAGAQPVDAAAMKQGLTNVAKVLSSTQIPFDAYLDDQGRLRRFVAVFSVPVPGAPKTEVQITSATELFGFGTPVTVTTPASVPPASGAPAASGASAPPASGASRASGAPGSSGTRHGATTTPPAHPSSPTGTHK